jgi:Nif-specific regulatory protein
MLFELAITSGTDSRVVKLDSGTRWQIGRGRACQIRVADSYVSAEHAELLLSGEELLLRCLSSTNPILVHGKPIESVQLKDGSRFTLGRTEFLVTACQPTRITRLVDTRTVLAANSAAASTPSGDSATATPRQSTRDFATPALMAQIFTLLRDSSDKQALARQVLDLVCHRLKATRAFLASVEPHERINVFMARGFPDNANIASLISTTILRRILDERQAVLLGDTAAPESGVGEQPSILQNEIRAVACTPISDNHGQVSGLLYVDNQSWQKEFSTSEAEFLIWVGQIYNLLAENLEMRRRLEAEIVTLKRTAGQAQIVAESPAMMQLLDRARKAAASDAAILLLGESGAGKEHIARLLHQQSTRADRRVIARNCAAIPENLFESEMFGHKKGAFTGADADRKGAFQEADGGTLFLDEIGDLAYTLQTKLLRAIQEKVIQPVGGDRDVSVDVRLVCATNKDLRESCRKREFREDLFFRISTITLTVPPLRERPEDIAPLADYFAQQLSSGTRHLSSRARDRLKTYHWPGNVRELRSVIEQAVVFAAGSEIEADELNLPASSSGRVNLDSFVKTPCSE